MIDMTEHSNLFNFDDEKLDEIFSPEFWKLLGIEVDKKINSNNTEYINAQERFNDSERERSDEFFTNPSPQKPELTMNEINARLRELDFERQRQLTSILVQESKTLSDIIATSQTINTEKVVDLKKLSNRLEVESRNIGKRQQKNQEIDDDVKRKDESIRKMEQDLRIEKEKVRELEDKKTDAEETLNWERERKNGPRSSLLSPYPSSTTFNKIRGFEMNIQKGKKKILGLEQEIDALSKEKNKVISQKTDPVLDNSDTTTQTSKEIKSALEATKNELQNMEDIQEKLARFKTDVKDKEEVLVNLEGDFGREIERLGKYLEENMKENENENEKEKEGEDNLDLVSNRVIYDSRMEMLRRFEKFKEGALHVIEGASHLFEKVKDKIKSQINSINAFREKLVHLRQSSISMAVQNILDSVFRSGMNYFPSSVSSRFNTFLNQPPKTDIIRELRSSLPDALQKTFNLDGSEGFTIDGLTRTIESLNGKGEGGEGEGEGFRLRIKKIESNKNQNKDAIEKRKTELEDRQKKLIRLEKELDVQEKIEPECESMKASILKKTSMAFNNKILLRTTTKLDEFYESLLMVQDRLMKKAGGYIDVLIEEYQTVVSSLESKRKDVMARFEEKLQAKLNGKLEGNEDIPIDEKKGLVDEMSRLIKEEEERTQREMDTKKEVLFVKLHDAIVNVIRGVSRTYRQVHLDFVGKTVRRRLYYIEKWRDDPSLNIPLDDFRNELDSLDKAKYKLSETARIFLKDTLVGLFESKVDSLNMNVVGTEKRAKILADQAQIRIDANSTFNSILVYYTEGLKVSDFVLDRQFIVLYFLKVVNFAFLLFSLYISESLFNEIYIKKVYRDKADKADKENKEDPPRLVYLVLLCYGLHTIMNLILVTILILMAYIFSDNIHPFVVDRSLLLHYLRDYAGVSLIHMGLCLLFAYIAEKKRYFRYQIEGLRTIRGVSEFILYLGILLYVIPFFFVFWT